MDFRKLLRAIVMLLVACSLSSCVYLVIGSVGALGGYVVSPDTVEGMTENSFEDVWAAAHEIVSLMGVVNEEDEASGMMIAKVSGAKITLTVSPLTKSMTKLTVKSRKSFFPRIAVAQDIFAKVITRLRE
jgi:hypothetical protein